MSRDDIGYDQVLAQGKYVPGVIDASTITWSALAERGSTVVDRAVALVVGTNDAFKLAADGEQIAGRLERVEADGKCSVQVGGFMELPAGGTLARRASVVGAVVGGTAGGIRVKAATPDTGEAEPGRGVVWNNAVALKTVVYFP